MSSPKGLNLMQMGDSMNIYDTFVGEKYKFL